MWRKPEWSKTIPYEKQNLSIESDSAKIAQIAHLSAEMSAGSTGETAELRIGVGGWLG
jgi:hypothetical protein